MNFFLVNAFTKDAYCGNPAAICLLESQLSDHELQRIATENNVPATVFLWKKGNTEFDVRFFTPEYELDICGHGLLAAAHIAFSELGILATKLSFYTQKKGCLHVREEGGKIWVEFDALPGSLIHIDTVPNISAYEAQDRCFLLLATEEEVLGYIPDFPLLESLGYRGVTITAPSSTFDFISRTFYPKKKIKEDSVCGAAHRFLAPFWGERLRKTVLLARQGSPRKGEIECRLVGNQVHLGGYAYTSFRGDLFW